MTDFTEIFGRFDFYHILEVAPGVFTPGIEYLVPGQKVVLEAMKRVPIQGRRVLDIGCRDGLCSLEAERRGASEVIGIDNDVSQAATDFLIPHFKSNVKMVGMNLYDLEPEKLGLFDVVLFPGVLYHLRYPIWGLKKILSILKDDGQLIVETGILDGFEDHALMYCPIGADSPYEATSITFFNVKGLSDTLYSIGATVREVLFLEPRAVPQMAYTELPPPPPKVLPPLPPPPLRRREHLKIGITGNKPVPPPAWVPPDPPPHPPLPMRPVLPSKLPVNRGTFICEVTRDVINPVHAKYWDLTHSFHTKGKF